MSKTIDELRAQGERIANATQAGENTATRVGGTITDIVDHIASLEDGNGAVANIAQGAVGRDSIANGSVDEYAISDGAVKTSKIADAAVVASKLAQGAVTTDALADDAVTTDKIAQEAITQDKLDDIVKSLQWSEVQLTDIDALSEVSSLNTITAYKVKSGKTTCGYMFMTMDSGTNQIVQYMITSLILPDNYGYDYNQQSLYVRTFARKGSYESAQGTWSTWRKMVSTFNEKLSFSSDGRSETYGFEIGKTIDLTASDVYKLKEVLNKFEGGMIYDVSAHNNGAVFESLKSLLNSTNLSTLIPISVRRGGMTIRFIQGPEQSSDNKYVQYRLMATSFSTTESDWQGVADEPKHNSNNLVSGDGLAKTYGGIEKNENFISVLASQNNRVLETYNKQGKKTLYDDLIVKGDIRTDKAIFGNIKNVIEYKELQTFGWLNNESYRVSLDASNSIATMYGTVSAVNGFLKSIKLDVKVAGTFTFAVGTMDQRNWAIIRKTFNVATSNTGNSVVFDVADLGIDILKGEQLFVYNQHNGGEKIGWLSYQSQNTNPNFYYGSAETAALAPFDGMYGGGFTLLYEVQEIESNFASKSELENLSRQLSSVSEMAQKAYNGLGTVKDLNDNLWILYVNNNGELMIRSSAHSKICVIGNSLVGGFNDNGSPYGMAATIKTNDFSNMLLEKFKETIPSSTLNRITIADWERTLTTDDATFDVMFADLDTNSDLLVIRIGENVNDATNLQTATEALLSYLKRKCTFATIVVTSDILRHYDSINNPLRNAAIAQSCLYCDIDGTADKYKIGTSRMYTDYNTNAIVPSSRIICTHSNDLGFAMIANAILTTLGVSALDIVRNITNNLDIDNTTPLQGVKNGIVTILTYGNSAPSITVTDAESNNIPTTNYMLSNYTYDKYNADGTPETATYATTFIMPNTDVTIS